MKDILMRPQVQIQKSSLHGYGVFACKDFVADYVIEECYALIIQSDDVELLKDFTFAWPAGPKNTFALALGYGSMYNHSENPNAEFDYDISNQLILIKAMKPIKEDEEIFISYGDDWFSKRENEPTRLKGEIPKAQHNPLNIANWIADKFKTK